jgi:soluble lytic murein transglycosylase-like protein
MNKPLLVEMRATQSTVEPALPASGRVLRACMSVALAASPALVYGQIYAGTSPQSGALILSSFAANDTSVLLMPALARPDAIADPANAPGRAHAPRATRPISPELQRIVDSAAARSAISSRLIHAVIETESQYEPKAVSTRGAIGLMQLLPSTAKRFGAKDPFDPGQNVSAGAAYLKWLMGFFGDDLELVLAGYNAGEQAVVRAGRKVPPYAETQAYVKKVMAALQRTVPAPL